MGVTSLRLLLARRSGIGGLIYVLIEHPIPTLVVGVSLTGAWFGGNALIERRVVGLPEAEAAQTREGLKRALGFGLMATFGAAIFYAASKTLW